MTEKEKIDKLEEFVDALIPILEEMEEIKKIVGEKTFNEVTKKLIKHSAK
jgi:glycine cleavage system protein P-like pyridoxal-binding family